MKAAGGLAAALTTLCVFAIATPAEGAATRAEYVAQAEPICLAAEQQAQQGQRHVIRRLRKHARRLKKKLQGLEGAAKERPELTKFTKRKALRFVADLLADLAAPANIAFDQATTQLRSLLPAPGDESAIAAWLAGRSEFVRLNYLAISAGHHGKFKRFILLTAQANESLRLGQTPIAAFGFDRCFLEPDGPRPRPSTFTGQV